MQRGAVFTIYLFIMKIVQKYTIKRNYTSTQLNESRPIEHIRKNATYVVHKNSIATSTSSALNSSKLL